MPTISVIVPVYNAERYLGSCLDSIIAQSFDDFELILIDDGSTDGSGVICDQYCTRDHRFTVIHQKNQGSSSARNRGLDICRGEYICFIDADDWVASDHLENLYNTIQRNNADIASIAFYQNDRNGNVTYVKNKPSDLSSKTMIKEGLIGSLHAGVVLKIFKAELIRNNRIIFPEYNYFEDMFFSICSLKNASTIAYSSKATYFYQYNPNSQTNNTNATQRAKSFMEFAENLTCAFNTYRLWEDEELTNSLFQRINDEKIRILKGKINRTSKDVLQKYYPDSYKEYRVARFPDIFPKLAIKYRCPFFIKLLSVLVKAKACFVK